MDQTLTFGACSLKQFYDQCAIFLRDYRSCNPQQVINGAKAVSLLYFGLPDMDTLSPFDQFKVVDLVHRINDIATLHECNLLFNNP